MESIERGFEVLIILLGLSSPILVVGIIYYMKKRLEHKQIMAAIEKGVPVSDLIPPKPQPAGPPWIKYVSVGIALPIIALGFLVHGRIETVIAFVLCGVGAGWVVRGVLHRKYQLQSPSVSKDSAAAGESRPGTPSSETPQ
jgi:hypothetical protein